MLIRPFGLLLVTCLIASAAPAPAADSIADDGISQCNFHAWSTDRDPAGLNIRSGPGTGYPVIGTIAPPRMVWDMLFYSDVSVTGPKDGWFRISTPSFYDNEREEEEIFFSGEGWVSGGHLSLAVESLRLFEAPSRDAPVAADFIEEHNRDPTRVLEDFIVDRPVACEDHWVEVEGVIYGRQFRGWADDVCPFQLTTCS